MSDIVVGKDRCDWDRCPNTAHATLRNVTLKPTGASLWRTLPQIDLCVPHLQMFERTGRLTLRDTPENLGALDTRA